MTIEQKLVLDNNAGLKLFLSVQQVKIQLKGLSLKDNSIES